MYIKGVSNYSFTPSFQRRPKQGKEEKDYRDTINKSFNALGSKEKIIIAHGSCYPGINRNTYIGSPFGEDSKIANSFFYLHGFNGVQQGPLGELQKNNNSPYNSSAFAKNRLFIDLRELTKPEYGKILSKRTYERLTSIPKTSENNYDRTDFSKASKIYNISLKEASDNFMTLIDSNAPKNPKVKQLIKDFNEYKYKYRDRLKEECVFKMLADKYKTDDFSKWGNYLDRDLSVRRKNNDKRAELRFNEILYSNYNNYNQHCFEQFMITHQIKENKKWRDNLEFKYINDLLVGCSKMDQWRYKDAFLRNYEMGAYEHDSDPQLWGIPVINPRKLFSGPNLDLNSGGQFLKEKLDYALEFCENVRVDHALGLIDPYLIDTNSIKYDKDGKLIRHNLSSGYMSQMIDYYNKTIDDYYSYPRIIEKIIIPTLQEHGLKPEDAVWEHICQEPELFKKVYYELNNLPKLIQLEFSKIENQENRNWYLVGSHDSIPAHKMLEREWTRANPGWDSCYLGGYLNSDPARAEDREKFVELISKNDSEKVKAKFAELLTADKFQISFADFLGITDEDVVYNIGGTNRKDNWKLRMTSDFIDKYYEDLSSKNPTAINVPEVLAMALDAKLQKVVARTFVPNNEEETIFLRNKKRRELYKQYQPLLDKLNHYAEILKKPE